jgi:hypothetical protein
MTGSVHVPCKDWISFTLVNSTCQLAGATPVVSKHSDLAKSGEASATGRAETVDRNEMRAAMLANFMMKISVWNLI